MGDLTDTNRVEPFVGEVTDNGKLFLGWKEWVQTTHGAWFNREIVAEARNIAQMEIILNDHPNVYSVLRNWAEARGLNAYQASVLAGVIWSEVERKEHRD